MVAGYPSRGTEDWRQVGILRRISQREGATGEGKGLDLEDLSSGKGWRLEDIKGWESREEPRLPSLNLKVEVSPFQSGSPG